MTFISAQEMYDHLAELVDDEEFILRAIRVHFPAFKKEMRRTAPKFRAKPAHADPYGPQSFHQQERMIRDGSRELLRALHREHPAIMRHAASKGRLVVSP